MCGRSGIKFSGWSNRTQSGAAKRNFTRGGTASKADPEMASKADPLFFCSSEVRQGLIPCGRICEDPPPKKFKKQNELGAKFPDKRYKSDKKLEQDDKSYRKFAICS